MAEVIRYLSDSEKDRTKPLWERIFAEDSDRFLDYYYEVKTADNEILVLERDGEILSMLQLNPYRLQLGAAQVEAAYVIAVATDSRYRHQGMMARLLRRAMQDRQEKEQPFLFLMPAAEAIYRPFGFRFIYRQQSMTGVPGVPDDAEPLTPVEDHSPVKAGLPQKPDGRKGSTEAWKLSPVAEDELEAAARFAEDQLSRRHIRVRTIRDRYYYHVLKKECQAENGNLCWMLQGGCRQGLVAYTYEEAVEVREPLLPEPEQLEEALNGCFGSFHRPLYVYGIVPGKERNGVQKAEGKPESGKWKQEPVRPVIMARALDLSVLTEGVRAVCPVSLVLDLEDGILPDNTGRFLWQVSELESCWEKLPAFGESGKFPVLRASVDEFVQLLFPGGEPAVSAALLERMAPEVQEVWGKLSVYTNVFLNEIV
ncbi:GNAT family N-acetyltransferase [Oscillospiraceae bacterium Marseille-Q3528]|nr:GNAT family N-acetyltransferase [Oscillospiraceae bacterium Marseille-Q3528]